MKLASCLLLLTMLFACSNNPQAGKVDSDDKTKSGLGALYSVVPGPTTTSSLADGLYSPVAVTLSCNDGAGSGCLATYYTIDGTTPNRASTVYTGPIPLWSKTTLKYFSINKAGEIEPVKTQNFLVGSIAIADIRTFAGGWNHTLGIKSDGTLWAWGGNGSGQLGDGTATNRKNPVQIGSGTTWSAIAAGNSFSLGLKSDGTLWAWGENGSGQLGDGTTIDRNAPVQVGTAATWSAIAAGDSFSLALRSDGTLWAWGGNSFGQLGDGTTTAKNAPVRIGTGTIWSKIAAGYSHAVALMDNGTLWAWGGNSSGQLGIGNNVDSTVPLQVPGTNWSAVSAGGSGLPYPYPDSNPRVGGHTVALKSDGTLWAWGENIFGQLGDGTALNMGWAGAGTYPLKGFATFDRSLPFQIGIDTDWSVISAGAGHTVALKKNGTLWAWGLNVNGQLANGNAGFNNLLPLPVGPDSSLPAVLPKHPWSSISAGGYHTIALRSDSTLWSWGWNGSGQLGDGTTVSTGGGSSPVTVTLGTDTATLPTWKTPKFAYVLSNKVYTYTLDFKPANGSAPSSGSGQLIPAGAAVSAGTNPASAVVHPSGSFLYVTDSTVATVEGEKVSYIHPFAIDPATGGLTEIGGGTGVKTLYAPTVITVDPLGRFVYVVGTHSKGWQAIAVYTVNPVTGELTCTGTVVQGAVSMVIEPLGKFAYVLKALENTSTDTGVTGYSIDQTTGMLTSVIKDNGETNVAEVYLTSARYLATDLSGQFLYVAKAGGSTTTTDVWGTSTTTQNPTEVRVYKINRASGKIYDTDTPQGLSQISPIAISPAGLNDNGFSVDSHTQFMFMLLGYNLYGLTLNQVTGQVNPVSLAQLPVTSSLGPVTLPTGGAVYMITSGAVYGYGIDAASGKVQAIASAMATNAGAGGTLKALVFASY